MMKIKVVIDFVVSVNIVLQTLIYKRLLLISSRIDTCVNIVMPR